MEYVTLILLLIIALFTPIFLFLFISNKWSQILSKPTPNLPPGPPPYPIIGNILDVLHGNFLETFTKLSKTYGPIMTLKFGNVTTIVISSPEIAREALQKNASVIAERTVPYSMWTLLQDYCDNSVIWRPSSPKWRILRRVLATKFISPQKLDSTQSMRKKKVQDLLDYLHELCSKGEALDIGEAIFITNLNIMSNTLFSMDSACYSNSYANSNAGGDYKFEGFKDAIVGFTKQAGEPKIEDFFPIFRLVFSRAKMEKHFTTLKSFIDGVIRERMHSKMNNHHECNDVLDSLLDVVKEENSELSLHEVLYLFADMFIAGIDTITTAITWAMKELMRNPQKMLKVKEELQQVLGKNGEIEESHISELPYLKAVVKETFRIHPPISFLVPHKSSEDLELAGFNVPKKTQILVNLWAMGRDTKLWSNSHLFEPERFLELDIDYKGQHFELITFGSGRRVCPGLPLASRSTHFILASLLHHFNWKLADEMKPEDINMNCKLGFTLQSDQPLRVVPIKV